MFEKIRTKISDFFNRLPAIILIPAVLLIAFAIAGFFIWAGIEMSPVTEKAAEDLLSGKATVQDSQNDSNRYGSGKNSNSNASQSSDGSGNSGVGSGLHPEPENSSNGGFKSGDLNQQGGTGGSSGGTGGSYQSQTNGNTAGSSGAGSGLNPEPENSSNGGFKSGDLNQQEGSDSSSGQQGDDSGAGTQLGNNSNINQNNSEQECYHPPGNVQKWWHNATPKQKECYISQHGQPNLGRQVPYFCDYNNSEDCYYR
ncbi:MAG: hypothetical protein V1690_01525 [Candidatus Moraniibacteriota bacterium]